MERRKSHVGVVIVTHNSEKTILSTLESVFNQTLKADEVFIIDSGSADTSVLKSIDRRNNNLDTCLMPNIGFAAANNLGFSSLSPEIEYILFLNPDVVLPLDLITQVKMFMETYLDAGAMTPKLIRYDFKKQMSLNKLDSTGIFSTWYGKWFDRGQGEDASLYTKTEEVEAICGAFFFARRQALQDVLKNGSKVFDDSFFCYKEDIDLSLRLKEKGWKLFYAADLIAYHGRGWQKRGRMARSLRLKSAENELKIHLRTKNPIKILYSFFKLAAVKVFDI